MNEQAPNEGRRGFLKGILGFGAATVLATGAMMKITEPEILRMKLLTSYQRIC